MFYKIIVRIANFLAILLYDIEVNGIENLRRCEGKPFIICPNHVFILDPVFIVIQRYKQKRAVIMAKAELFKIKIFAWMFRNVGAVAVERGKGDTSIIEFVQNEIKNGHPALIFPEGTRSKTGELLPLKAGALFVAASTNATILPCYIRYEKTKGARMFAKVTVTFDTPLTPEILALNPEDKATFRAAKNLLKERLVEMGTKASPTM